MRKKTLRRISEKIPVNHGSNDYFYYQHCSSVTTICDNEKRKEENVNYEKEGREREREARNNCRKDEIQSAEAMKRKRDG